MNGNAGRLVDNEDQPVTIDEAGKDLVWCHRSSLPVCARKGYCGGQWTGAACEQRFTGTFGT
jgi:hypothetical protein